MIFRKVSVIALLLFVLGPLSAQDNDDFFFGKLIDATTGEPIVYATVRVKGKALGVISNNDGGFRIPISFNVFGDSLEISSMGYQTKWVGFSAFRKNISRQILLKPFIYELPETIVTAKKRRKRVAQDKAGVTKPLTPKQIIRKAMARIPQNYDQEAFSLVGYYRDYQIQNQAYINLNEALIKVFDQGFEAQDYNTMQFGLYSYRPNLEFMVDSVAAKPYNYQKRDKYIPNVVFNNTIVPNELVLLFNHDAIRYNNVLLYSYVDVFSRDFIRKHDFITYFQTNYGNKSVYKIKFVKHIDRFQVKGDIYIDVDTYAIRKLDYAVFQKKKSGRSIPGLPEAGSELAYYDEAFLTPGTSNAELELLYEILVEYREFTGRMYLNYISFHNRFKLVRPPEFYLKDLFVNYDSREVQLLLNKPAKNWRSLRPGDLKFYYGENRLKVTGLTQTGPSAYTLDFVRKRKAQRKMLREFFKASETSKNKKVNLEISNLMDFDGNVLGADNSELIDQFREFFSQKIIVGSNREMESKHRVNIAVSLGHKEQPKLKAESVEEFWMNTPLRSNFQK